MNKLKETIARVRPLNAEAVAAARARTDSLTKPPGSLGRLEELAIKVAAITGEVMPAVRDRAIIVMAGDHGVTAEGVSAYPAEVTAQMVFNFLRGGAAINVLARQAGARVVVAADLGRHPDLLDMKVAPGTANMAQGPAMTREQAVQAVETGIVVVERELQRGFDLVGTGDMGIGNTTPSAAIIAAITGAPVASITGRGTGIDDSQLANKVAVIERALAINRPDPGDPLDVLAKVGGFEIGGLAGVMLGAAAARRPVVIDGFISGAAALIATELCPQARDYLIPAHSSVEIGHRVILERLELAPLLNLNLRLGEGTGAAMAMLLVDAALRIQREMATFAEAGVSEALDEADEVVVQPTVE